MRRASLLLPMLTMTACGAKSGSGASKGVQAGEEQAAVLSQKPADNGLTETQIDINGDGRADVYNYSRMREDAPPLLIRKEVDLNWDGRIDVRTWFDETGTIEKEEMDGDFDGRVDWVDHYQGGVRVMSEVDTDFNGSFDLFRYYEGGVVRRKERDSNSDGRVDFWEYLDESGKVLKTGRDVDGDGVMDIRED